MKEQVHEQVQEQMQMQEQELLQEQVQEWGQDTRLWWGVGEISRGKPSSWSCRLEFWATILAVYCGK